LSSEGFASFCPFLIECLDFSAILLAIFEKINLATLNGTVECRVLTTQSKPARVCGAKSVQKHLSHVSAVAMPAPGINPSLRLRFIL